MKFELSAYQIISSNRALKSPISEGRPARPEAFPGTTRTKFCSSRPSDHLLIKSKHARDHLPDSIFKVAKLHDHDMRHTPNYKSKRGKKKRSKSRSSSFFCFRLEVLTAAAALFVLTFFIKLVHNLEKEWAEKWSSLDGLLDDPSSGQVRASPDYQDLSAFEPVKRRQQIGPKFSHYKVEKQTDEIMNKLINHATPLFTGGLENAENLDFSKIHEKFIQPSVEKQTDDSRAENVSLPREAKSVSLLIPINERGNSSTIIRMIHRQWYNAMLSSWGDTSSKPELNLRFVLASPAAQSKASTLDRNFGDLRASAKRVLSDLPLDMLKNAQVEARDPVDIVILLHSSFILLPQDGLKFLMGSVNADNTVICLGTGAIQCKDDSVALDRSAARLNYEQMLALLKEKKQSTKVASFKPVRTYSLPGLKSAYLDSFAADSPGLTFPTKYLSPGNIHTKIHEVLSPPKSGICKISTKHIIFVLSKSEENRSKLKASFDTDGQLFVGSFEVIFVTGRQPAEDASTSELMMTDLSEDYDGFETAALFAALNYLQENCHSETLESVTILRDSMRLNIRRLFREILGPGLKTNDLVCLEAIDEPSLPDFFDRSSFIWGANWPNPNLALPATCSSLSFSLSSKTAELLVQKYSQLAPSQVHNSAKFLTGIMRHLISVKNITELSISRVDPSFRSQSVSREPIIDNDTFQIS